MPPSYIGRFAPSPTGPLHFGSLVCALASYLDAKGNGGLWGLRIEDIDPPREIPGAASAILHSLEVHGLAWDGPVIWQSQRSAHYRAVLDQLSEAGQLYACTCTRKRLESLGHRYDGHCRSHTATSPAALRLKIAVNSVIRFTDRHLGQQVTHLGEQGDFILLRKDGLFAYALAVVVDDWQQGITQVVRGSDLLSATANQIYLYQLLKVPVPVFTHIPVITNGEGLKLSKQNHAPALDERTPSLNLWRALGALGAKPPEDLQHETPEHILSWGLTHWAISQLAEGLSRPEELNSH